MKLVFPLFPREFVPVAKAVPFPCVMSMTPLVLIVTKTVAVTELINPGAKKACLCRWTKSCCQNSCICYCSTKAAEIFGSFKEMVFPTAITDPTKAGVT